MVNFSSYPGFAARMDLAMEATSILRGDKNIELPGIDEQVCQKNGTTIHTITILNQQGEQLIGKKCGRYITLSIPPIQDSDTMADIAEVTANQLSLLLPEQRSDCLLAVGLGNNQAIADALGPRVIEQTYATRHLPLDNSDWATVCAIAPGVLGVTGIETAEILKGLCDHVHPSAMLVVDSLAASSISRVGTTIQMAENGISPGSGIGNNRMSINQETMGVPVIAIGVPTVVSALSIISETAGHLCGYWQSKGMDIPEPDEKSIEYAEQNLLTAFDGKLMVTPKDIDDLIDTVAQLIAAAIAIAVHPAADKNNYHDYLR